MGRAVNIGIALVIVPALGVVASAAWVLGDWTILSAAVVSCGLACVAMMEGM